MKKRRRRFRRRLLLLVALVALGIYLVKDSELNIETTEYNISSEKIPAAFDGFKIVQISDYHGAELAEPLAEKVRQESPDIIAITGDILTEAADISEVEELLSSISGIAPIYFVSGNHDFASGEIPELEALFETYGVRYLKNEWVSIEKDGERIVLAGVEDPNGWEDMDTPDIVAAKLRNACPDDYAVLLAHRNYWAEEYPGFPVDLILCGHAHGGLIRLPYIGGLVSTDRTLFPEYEGGLYECGNYNLIVSRGIGNSVSVPRLFNRPELVSVVLNAE